MPRLAKDKYCTGCLACMDACRHEAISVVLKNEMPFPKVNIDKCVDCKLCEKTCPVISPVKGNEVVEELAFGGWTQNECFRKKAASGGAFVGIAQTFFQRYPNSAVVGASLQANHVKHICIEKAGDIELLMNSKYVQSRTDGIFKKVAKMLAEGKCVLFSGLPCQVAGLYGYIGNRESYKKRLWTIDLVCHGVASQEALDLHLEHYHANKIVAFRNKDAFNEYGTSQCTTLLVNGKQKIINRESDIFYNVFASWLTDRKSCHDCRFARLTRIADVTIGDFWGKKNVHDRGVSLILANNSHGQELVKESNYIHVWKSTMREAIDSNANLWIGWKATKWHPLVIWPVFFRNILPSKIRLGILTRQGVWKILWGPFKIITNLHIKIEKQKLLKKYKDIL